MKKQIFLLIILACSLFTALAQDQQKYDSLKLLLKNHNARKLELNIKSPSLYDTTEANILFEIIQIQWRNNLDLAMDYAKQCLSLSEKIGYIPGIGNAYLSMGNIHTTKGNYQQAQKFFQMSFNEYNKVGYKKGIARYFTNKGILYDYQANYPEALRNHFASLKISEEIGDKQSMAAAYNNIGVIYFFLKSYDEANVNYFKAKVLNEETGNKLWLGTNLGNIGEVYMKQGKYAEALKNFIEDLKISEESNNPLSIGLASLNIGIVYSEQGNYPEALKNCFAALKVNEEFGYKYNIAYSANVIGKIFEKQGNFIEALKYTTKGLQVATEVEAHDLMKESYQQLSVIDSAMNNFRSAFEHHKLYMQMNDSIFNLEKERKITSLQMNYDFDKKQIADSLKFAKEKEVGQLKLQRQKAITYTGFVGIAITLLFLFYVYRSYSKQRIAHQKLKEAQAQLIKSEKMAAFGVMASRVSHEILNPLNFINNFAELSRDIVKDIHGSVTNDEQKENAETLTTNLEKINEHGKRATDIVKQLQEHSRKGSAHEFFEET